MKSRAAAILLLFVFAAFTHGQQVPERPVTAVTSSAAASAAKRVPFPLSPERANPVRIPKFEKAPVIDGELGDDEWKEAAVFKEFFQTNPGDNIEPSYPTVFMMAYDSKFLYIGVKAFDDPANVRATVAKRDQVFGEDNVRVFLDTFNDKRKAYIIGFNPLGIQQDGIMTEGGNTDFNVDIVMESKGSITEDGYVVEAAIPFKSLRYSAGKGKIWGIHLWRNIDRFNDEMDSWMPISRDSSGLLNQAGQITGLDEISTERTIEIIPSLTLLESGRRARTYAALPPGIIDQGRFLNEPLTIDPGLTVKFNITPNVTLDFAANPDFAQVEADATVVTANQRFPIFFEEKRPFFLEGIDIFRTPINAVHTRSIVDPDVAVKLTGKTGRNTFGILLASDNGPGNFTGDERLNPNNARFLDKNAYAGILRLKRDVGKESSIGLLATSYNFIEKHNQLGGFDGRFRFDKITTLSFQVLGSTSRRYFRNLDTGSNDYRTGNGFGYSYSFNRSGRHFYMGANGGGRTRDYRSDLGFVSRTNTNNTGMYAGYNPAPKPKALLISWNVNTWAGMSFDWQRRLQNWSHEVTTNFEFPKSTYLTFGFFRGAERLFEEEFGTRRGPGLAGAFFGNDPERTTKPKGVYGFASTTPSKKYSVQAQFNYTVDSFDYDFGAGPRYPRVSPAALADPSAPLDPGPGKSLRISANFALQPTNALRSTLSVNKSRFRRTDTGRVAFDDNIFSWRTTYQFTKFIFARARIDYSTLSQRARAQFLFGWTPNPGTSFYAGYNDDMTRNGYNPFSGDFEPGLRRNGRTFFIKMSYLIRKSF